MAILSGCSPEVCSPGEGYDASIHPVSLLTASNIAAGCALLLLAGVVVLAVVYWRDERPAWKRATPLVIFAVGMAATLVALSARLTYTGYLHPGLSPDAPPLDWYRHIGLAGMDRLSQQIFLYDVTDVTLVPVTLLLVVAGVVLLQTGAANLRRRQTNQCLGINYCSASSAASLSNTFSQWWRICSRSLAPASPS